MKSKEMRKFIKHCDKYFEQSDCTVLHPTNAQNQHIDVLLYRPSKKYPFWKLVTMGASDYKMPPISNTISLRNEYIMFVDPLEDLEDKETGLWYYNKLLLIANFAYCHRTHITYAHSIQWQNEDVNEEMIAAFIEFPMVIETADILRCKLNFWKPVACLQVVLLNESDLESLKEIGPQAFSEYLYPECGGVNHFISQRHRSEKF